MASPGHNELITPYSHFLAFFSLPQHGITQFSKNGGLQLIVDNQSFLRRMDIDAATLDTPETSYFTVLMMRICVWTVFGRHMRCATLVLTQLTHYPTGVFWPPMIFVEIWQNVV